MENKKRLDSSPGSGCAAVAHQPATDKETRTHNQIIGQIGEDAAASLIEKFGWQIVDRNWRCRFGEIDIIAQKDGVLGFFEVKTRSTDRFGLGAEAITAAKRRRLRRLGSAWLQTQDGHFRALRLIVLEIHLRSGNVARVRVIEVDI